MADVNLEADLMWAWIGYDTDEVAHQRTSVLLDFLWGCK